MASTINASSSGSGGLISTGDASGVLQLQSNGTLAVSISGATTTLSGNMVVNNQVSSSGDLILDAVFSVMIKKSGSTNATINQFGIGLAGSSLSSGIGIAFPASQSASTNPNTLDDYEEGTWTPTLAATFGSLTYSVQIGRYVKIGGLVYASFSMYINTVSSGSGNLAIAGLPFTPTVTTGVNEMPGNLAMNTAQPTYNNIAFYASQTQVFVYNASGGIMTGGQVTNGCSFAGTIMYKID